MDPEISALILAAGESRRMGQPKMLLPWGETTVLGKVISTFAAGFAFLEKSRTFPVKGEIVVVTGGSRLEVEELMEKFSGQFPLRAVFNPDYAKSEMLGSLQKGLSTLELSVKAALIGLGDQPQVKVETVRDLCLAYSTSNAPLVIPSFQQRRGHPWLVARSLWPEILALPAASTPRQFLQEHAEEAEYIPADESILQDLDTPATYRRQRP